MKIIIAGYGNVGKALHKVLSGAKITAVRMFKDYKDLLEIK